MLYKLIILQPPLAILEMSGGRQAAVAGWELGGCLGEVATAANGKEERVGTDMKITSSGLGGGDGEKQKQIN